MYGWSKCFETGCGSPELCGRAHGGQQICGYCAQGRQYRQRHHTRDLCCWYFSQFIEDNFIFKNVNKFEEFLSSGLGECFTVIKTHFTEILFELNWPPKCRVNHCSKNRSSASLINTQLKIHVFDLFLGVFLKNFCQVISDLFPLLLHSQFIMLINLTVYNLSIIQMLQKM